MNEEDVPEITSQTSPTVQVTYLSAYHSPDINLTLAPFNQIQRLPSKRARVTSSSVQVK